MTLCLLWSITRPEAASQCSNSSFPCSIGPGRPAVPSPSPASAAMSGQLPFELLPSSNEFIFRWWLILLRPDVAYIRRA